MTIIAEYGHLFQISRILLHSEMILPKCKCGRKTTLRLHFDLLSAVMDLTESGFSEFRSVQGLMEHQCAKFQGDG